MDEDALHGLPADLAAVLRDQSVVVSQDAAVFELVAAWIKAGETEINAVPTSISLLCGPTYCEASTSTSATAPAS